MVFFSHLLGTYSNSVTFFGMELNDTPLRLLWGGSVAVIVFFVLSGFFSYSSRENATVKHYIQRLWKRYKRIYPLFFIVMIFSFVLIYTQIPFDTTAVSEWMNKQWQVVPTGIEKIKAFSCALFYESNDVNPVVWTLRIELRMAFILPFFVWG